LLRFFKPVIFENQYKTMIIDSHSHIYLSEFNEDRVQMLSRAENEGVEIILMPAIDNQTHTDMLRVEKDFPGKCLAMMGLHPCEGRI
jgi:TatD DNase family protein